jgi:hypothetical protein
VHDKLLEHSVRIGVRRHADARVTHLDVSRAQLAEAAAAFDRGGGGGRG